MAFVLSSPTHQHFGGNSAGINTIPDPPSPSPASSYSAKSASSPSDLDQHPDLDNEVAALSAKLVNAINHSASLDDTLQDTRHALETARARIEQLERAVAEHTALISQGLLVEKAHVDVRERKLETALKAEQARRLAAENEQKKMQIEVEGLTASLFEEANLMVAAARKETELSNHRVAQLQTQLGDTETLLASQQEQLLDLKAVMHQMSDRDENESNTRPSSAPSTPGLGHGKFGGVLEAAKVGPVGAADEVQPQHPLFYTQLLTPVLRTDLPGHADFLALLHTSKHASSSPTASGAAVIGSFPTMTSMSLALGGGPTTSSAPHTPPLTPSSASAPHSPPRRDSLGPTAAQAPLPPLKDSKYFKRVLADDIEPTLRLDLATGISWLARRSVLNAITSQTLTIEPLAPPPPAIPAAACALCGENGRAERHARRHQFRIADEGAGSVDKAQRWPLCDWCVGRVRSVCDFVAFLRMCQGGVWRVEEGSVEREREAWEEGVRLRERMWWARVGGGVVPVLAGRAAGEAEGRRESKGEEGCETLAGAEWRRRDGRSSDE